MGKARECSSPGQGDILRLGNGTQRHRKDCGKRKPDSRKCLIDIREESRLSPGIQSEPGSFSGCDIEVEDLGELEFQPFLCRRG